MLAEKMLARNIAQTAKKKQKFEVSYVSQRLMKHTYCISALLKIADRTGNVAPSLKTLVHFQKKKK